MPRFKQSAQLWLCHIFEVPHHNLGAMLYWLYQSITLLVITINAAELHHSMKTAFGCMVLYLQNLSLHRFVLHWHYTNKNLARMHHGTHDNGLAKFMAFYTFKSINIKIVITYLFIFQVLTRGLKCTSIVWENG